MVEQQIEVEILVADGHPFLAREEGEVTAEFQQKPLEFLQNGRFQIAFTVGILQAEEIKQVRVAENELGCQPVGVSKLLEVLANGRIRQSEIAVRSNIRLRTRSRSVRTLHRSSRHISA